jgi:hypothetical protein
MPARKQQTFAKRARELAVKEKRERKAAKKAEARAARDEPVTDEGIDGENIDEDGFPITPEADDAAAATPSAQEIG